MPAQWPSHRGAARPAHADRIDNREDEHSHNAGMCLRVNPHAFAVVPAVHAASRVHGRRILALTASGLPTGTSVWPGRLCRPNRAGISRSVASGLGSATLAIDDDDGHDRGAEDEQQDDALATGERQVNRLARLLVGPVLDALGHEMLRLIRLARIMIDVVDTRGHRILAEVQVRIEVVRGEVTILISSCDRLASMGSPSHMLERLVAR